MKKLIFAILTFVGLVSMTSDNIRKYTASFYHDKYHGRKTASGVKFDQNKKTAASNNYPLGTIVKVTNPNNGKTTIVKINDRMHPKYSHRIDLSKSAFKDLAPLKQGVIKNVEVEVLNEEVNNNEL